MAESPAVSGSLPNCSSSSGSSRRVPYGSGRGAIDHYRLMIQERASCTRLRPRSAWRTALSTEGLTPNGEHVFLVANRSGRWLFVEARTGQPIADTLCDCLPGEVVAQGDRAANGHPGG
jgi:hypothetical protein